MHLILLSLFISVSAIASNWSELRQGETYKLIQDFEIEQEERSRAILDFSKGETVRLKEITSGPDVSLYVFDYNNCPGTALRTHLEMILVQGREVGAKVEDCELNIFLETKNLYYKSLFE